MTIEAIAIGIFLFVALSVAACRAADVLRKAKPDRRREVVEYVGPRYNAHGRELERR